MDALLELPKAVYGLKDAPLVWTLHFYRWIVSEVKIMLAMDKAAFEAATINPG